MDAQQFRRLALAITGAREGAHGGHPDFRLGGRIFASLDSPDIGWGMVKLTPSQQAELIGRPASAFRRAAGAWGRNGYTIVFLADARPGDIETALRFAAGNRPPRKAARARRRG